MNLEQELKDAFERHESDVQPSPDRWAGVERGVRRARARRASAVSALAVAMIAAVAVSIPLLSDDSPKGFAGDGDPSPSAPPDPTAGWTARVSVVDGFTLKIPTDWRGGSFEGHWDFHPKDLPGLPEGGDTFAVEVVLKAEQYNGGVFGSGPWSDATVNGRPAKRWQRPHASGAVADRYRIDWTGPCPPDATCVARTLEVTVQGSTAELWTRYEETGGQIVQTLQYYDGSKPVHGTVAETITSDGLNKALVRFLDARVEGIGADGLLTQEAFEQYGKRGEDALYSLDGRRFVAWSIDARSDADANSAEFRILLFVDGEGVRGPSETIGVGPGRNTFGENLFAVVRFTELIE